MPVSPLAPRLLALAWVAVFLLPAAGPAQAQRSGCEYRPIDIERFGGRALRLPPPILAADGELDARLTIEYGANEIGGCETRLRLYDGRLVGPTLVAEPGDTLNIDLFNRLPPNPPPIPPVDPNVPHDFNTTNLHTHGLHVSPAGNADNVLLRLQPGFDFQNEIKIPRDHPPGTFWYHPHVHGSTAVQVGSGMAGALIIRGGIDRLPTIERMTEQVLVFQQIPYDENGEVEDFSESFGPGVWDRSHRQTTVNGQIFPVIHMRPGEIQRWRMVHAGVRETLTLQLEGHTLDEIAVDGLVTGRIDRWRSLELQPGYRSDVLVQARPEAGRREYILYDGASSAARSLLQVAEDRQPLAKIVVEGSPVRMEAPTEAALRRFVPFAPIETVDGRQSVTFNIDLTQSPPAFTVDGRSFDLDHRRVLELGRAEEWTLSSDFVNHPFHIHVNPFEHWRLGPDGRRQRVFRDTLLIKQGQPETIRTRYTKYVGLFVLHCHILDHEDQGMMELVEVRLPGDAGHGGHDGHGGHGMEPAMRLFDAPVEAAAPADAAEKRRRRRAMRGSVAPAERIRQNIDDLTPEQLADYKHAVAKLKEISERDPTSKDGYDYFAALHDSGSVGPCEHKRDTFLPWHRALLLEFENALRRSDPPRTADVTVPYWDWSRVPSGDRYPEPFEDPSSVLFHRGRFTTPICKPNGSSSCVRLPYPWSYLDETADGAALWFGIGPGSYGGASDEAVACGDRTDAVYGALEAPSHNDMHSVYVGGSMRSPSTAAEDPIFWSFHAFIDLLWDDWQQRPDRVVDSCEKCRLCGLFKEPRTEQDPWTVEDTIDRAALGYEYAFTPPTPTVPEVSPDPRLRSRRDADDRPFAVHPSVDFSGQRPPVFEDTRVILVPPRVPQSVILRLDDVPQPAGISHRGEVYLYPSTEEFRPLERAFRERYLVDVYSIWQPHLHEEPGEHGDHGHGAAADKPASVDIVLDLTDAVRSLSERHVGEAWNLTIAGVPVDGSEGGPRLRGTAREDIAPRDLRFEAATVEGLPAGGTP